MKPILCIGEALIDMICTDKGRTLSEGDHFVKKAGGAPTNVAAAINAMGGKAALVAKVGVDPFGTHLLEVMKSFNVDTRWIVSAPDAFTTFAFVSLMENGERDFYFNRGADALLGIEDIKGIDPGDFNIVHLGSATAFLPGPLQSTYRAVLQMAIDNGHFISFDPNYRHLLFGNNKEEFKERSWHFIQHSNFFKVSDEEALLLTGCESVTEAANIFHAKTHAVFAITLGAEGTLLGMEKTNEVIPSIKVKSIDTTGAGDAFVGAVLYQLQIANDPALQSRDTWRQIIANANKAGARTCEYLGAMEAFRHLNRTIFM